MARAKRWRDGREYYTKALESLKSPSQKSSENVRPQKADEDEKRIQAIEEACYSNRALCNLSLRRSLQSLNTSPSTLSSKDTTNPSQSLLENYRSTLNDTASVLRINPTSIKALYRSASALFSLGDLYLPLAIDACEKGLAIDAKEPSLLALREKITSAMARHDEKNQMAVERLSRQTAEKETLQLALKQRGISVRTSKGAKDQQPDLEDAVVKLEDPMTADSTLSFPLLVLFPLAAQSDFIKSVKEDDVLGAVLDMVLPPPWDVDEGLYASARDVEVYAEKGFIGSDGHRKGKDETKRGLLKIGRKMGLGKVLGAGVDIVDGLVKVYVLPKSKAAGWVEEMKVRMKA